MNDKLTQIETALLARELKLIEEKLAKVGEDLIKIFSKYGDMRGSFGQELKKYLTETVIETSRTYFCKGLTSDHIIQPTINTNAKLMPESMKKVILDYCIKDLLSREKWSIN